MKTSKSEKSKFWANHLRSQASSGLSKRNYCIEKGLVYTQFMYRFKKNPPRPQALVPSQTFIPLTLPPTAPIEIVLLTGIRVRVSQLSPKEIASLVKELAHEGTP